LKYKFLILIILLINITTSSSQSTLINPKNLQSRILNYYDQKLNKTSKLDTNSYSLSFIKSFYLNTNLPNLENKNGYYFPKGYGSYSSFRFEYKSKYLFLSFEPLFSNIISYEIEVPEKNNQFSVLNDAQSLTRLSTFQNTGLIFQYLGFSFGFGNWNNWWGPGIHNSLVMTNNSEGFYNYFIGTSDYIKLLENLYINARYSVSKEFTSNLGQNYFLSGLFLDIKYKIFNFGYSKSILSGGYPDLSWSFEDAFWTLFNNNNNKYWDTIDDYYISAIFPDANLEIFLEIGVPSRSYGNNKPSIYSNHGTASNIGFRKKNIFGSKSLLFGVEYTRLVQSIYYNIIPSPNWYDNIKYNYSSFKGRRWSAHSGSDSDDLLIFFGYIDYNKSLIYGVNYERHGVNFHFPPEVKLESRWSANYTHQKIIISLYYENEYFEHYGFVDNSENVWNKTFEQGSIQKTKTILFSLGFNI